MAHSNIDNQWFIKRNVYEQEKQYSGKEDPLEVKTIAADNVKVGTAGRLRNYEKLK